MRDSPRMLPTMAGAANRCVIPEHKFNIEPLPNCWSRTAKESQPIFGGAGFGRRDV